MEEFPLRPTPEEARKSFREALTDYVSKGWTIQKASIPLVFEVGCLLNSSTNFLPACHLLFTSCFSPWINREATEITNLY